MILCSNISSETIEKALTSLQKKTEFKVNMKGTIKVNNSWIDGDHDINMTVTKEANQTFLIEFRHKIFFKIKIYVNINGNVDVSAIFFKKSIKSDVVASVMKWALSQKILLKNLKFDGFSSTTTQNKAMIIMTYQKQNITFKLSFGYLLNSLSLNIVYGDTNVTFFLADKI